MLLTGHHADATRSRKDPYGRGPRLIRAIAVLAALAVAGCQPTSAPPAGPGPISPGPATVAVVRPEAGSATQTTGAPAATVAAKGVAEGPGATATGVPASVAGMAPNGRVALLNVPILGSELTTGWDTRSSWNAQFAAGPDRAPAGAPAGASVWTATFAQDSSGLFFAVRQDSPRRYLMANFLGVRLWINPGPRELDADNLSLAVLSSDWRGYWSADDQAIPPPDPKAAGEVRLLQSGGTLPAGVWTELQIWLRKSPSAPRGRYLTGMYLRADGLAGQSIQLAGLELLAIPDETEPLPVSVSIIDLNSIRVQFSEDVDSIAAENPDNYRISSPGHAAYSAPRAPSSIKYEPDSMSAVVTFPEPLKPDVQYSIEIQRIADLAAQPHVQAAPVSLAFTAKAFVVKVDAAHPSHPISPLIYGIAGGTPEYLRALRPTIQNWGGNPSSRYNWKLGNAWNAASDWEYRNGDYGYKGKSASDDFIADAQAIGAEVRMTLPMLGWVAKNTDAETCSFTGPDGKCMNPQATCAKPGPVADPNRANVPTDVKWVVEWVNHMLVERKLPVRFFAFDNEPDLWGYTHYDVHPKCTTYDEILSKYLEYAGAVRAVAPQAELLGPVSCCWFFYWNSAAGEADKAKHGNRDFLPWFLEQIRQHDEKAGVRTLDALDIHYYPEGLYNDNADAATAKARLQGTRALWDKTYVDPSWIKEPVNLVPRMKQVIAESYPGTKLFISEWNFGADKTVNGALAIADVLGIYGQEAVYAATYWRFPELNSPGFFGFKMYTNYDDHGSRFGDNALPATSSDRDQVSVYASRDTRTGNTLVMLINKLPDRSIPVTLQLSGTTGDKAELFRYGQDHPEGITRQTVTLATDSTVDLPPYSITLLVVEN